MKFSLVAAAVLLSACGATVPHATSPDPQQLTLTDSAAARLPAAELIRMYGSESDGAAVYLSSLNCPSQSTRADSLFTGLLHLPDAPNRTRDYALAWSRLLSTCRDARMASWYRNAISRARDDLTIELLTRSLLQARDSLDIAAVKRAAFDTTNTSDARKTILSMYVDALYLSGQERLDLMLESYRQTGDVPADFIADQAARRWLLRTNWRQALLAEVIAAPGRTGAAPLLLALARETRENDERWRTAWETGLQVLEKSPELSSSLRSMIPIAREVSQSHKH